MEISVNLKAKDNAILVFSRIKRSNDPCERYAIFFFPKNMEIINVKQKTIKYKEMMDKCPENLVGIYGIGSNVINIEQDLIFSGVPA